MELKGSIVAIVTPFKDGSIDEAAFKKLIEFQIDNGTTGIVPCGTTGESATLSHQEHEHLIRLAVEYVDKRVPVIAGTGSNNTREAMHLTQAAKDAGADAALLITPYYNKPTQEGLYQHYKIIADTVELPLVLYNCPGRTGCSLSPATVARLAEHKNVVAVKDATGSMDWTSEVTMIPGLTVLSGDDSATLPQIALGAKGVISVLANVAPRATADLVARAMQGDIKGARELHHKYFQLMKTLFIESNPMPVKTAVSLMGMCEATLRAPLCPVLKSTEDALKKELKAVGLL